MSAGELPRDAFARLDAALEREWLVTNGLGSFAAGTAALANTRRYHGLLIASLRPPVERVMMVAKVEIAALYQQTRYELSTNEFADGTIAARGLQSLVRFELDGQIPVWTYACADALIELRVRMLAGENTTEVQLRVLHALAPVSFELAPLCGYRDYHSHMQGGWHLTTEPSERGVRVVAFEGARPYELTIDSGRFESRPDWYWRFRHRAEAERGLDADEDLFRPGLFHATVASGASVALTLSAEPRQSSSPMMGTAPAHERDTDSVAKTPQSFANEAMRDPTWIDQLRLAAEQFIVTRTDRQGQPVGKTVIAGYPWFTDWGRDTMIALPGLTLTTGRFADAAAILRTFAQHVSEGMLPNRFPDGGEPPEYNTADATLWFFHAIDCYVRATRDQSLLRELMPTLNDILAWHERGTRFGISVDREDGLLRAGVAGVQLTWMDAKVGDWVVTPRIGKPVEINALWHFAHDAMSRWQRWLGDDQAADQFARGTERIRCSFNQRFWNPDVGGLYDVIDGPEGSVDSAGRHVDGRIRPNQIFAVSLGANLLNPEQARAVVDLCSSELLTPVGLRSLSPSDREYAPHYGGGQWQRDGAYHQGTVWSWLLGPFALAHYHTYGDATHALAILSGIAPHIDEACVGTISEIFDADPPHAPRGCFAQAWSVAEVLRAYDALQAARNSSIDHSTNQSTARDVAATQRKVRHG
jgi:predicted glycogen debranching enzyme